MSSALKDMYDLAMSGSFEEVRYQVFVSSTFSDLKDEREKVLQAILECKAFPAGMELFPSADNEQFEFIKREIDSSDYYIVIIAGRYGSITEDGTSYTEKEFDYALAQEKPILAFLVRDPTKLSFDKCEADSEGRARLEQFRDKAKKSRLIKHYSNPDELKSHVLQSLNYQFKVNPRRGWVPAGQSRREDLEEIRALLNNVLNLEAENKQLRSLSNDATACLGQGDDEVCWTVDVSNLPALATESQSSSAAEKNTPLKDMEFRSTWNELLKALFYRGSSRVDDQDIQARLFYLFASRVSDHELRSEWKQLAYENLTKPHLDLNWLWMVKRDIHRQFTGLGLIEEVLENRYKDPDLGGYSVSYFLSGISGSTLPQSKQDPIPIQVVVWKLTRRGEEQLALISGFRRDGRS